MFVKRRKDETAKEGDLILSKKILSIKYTKYKVFMFVKRRKDETAKEGDLIIDKGVLIIF